MASGREYVTLSDVLVEYAPNRARFYAGKATADLASIVGGLILALLGITGENGGLVTALVTGGGSLAVTAAGIAIAAEGMAISVSAAGDIIVSLEKMGVEISQAGSEKEKKDERDSETRYSGDLQKVDNPDAAADALADIKWSMVLTVYRVHTVRKDGSIGTEDTVDRKICVHSKWKWEYLVWAYRSS